MNYGKKSSSHHISTLLASITILALGSAAYAGPVKADPAPISPFIQHPAAMTRNPNLPFNRVSLNPSQKAWDRVRGFDSIVILAVNTQYLHPYKQSAHG